LTKEQFNKRLKELDLTQKDFAKISGIPYSTINNWGYTSKDKTIAVPLWVKSFLEYYEKSLKYDYLTKEVFNIMNDLEKKKD